MSDVRNSGSGPRSDSPSELYGRGGSPLSGFAGPGDAEEIFEDSAPATGPGFLTHAWVHRLVGVLLGLTGLAALAAALAVAVFRIGDAYLIDHVAGAWMALGDYAAQGVLYPPFQDGDIYAGTRNMPVPIMLHGVVTQVMGDPLMAGKLLSAVGCFLISVALFAGTNGVPLGMRIALATAFLLTGAGTLVFSGIRHDALPVALQIGAIVLVERRRSAGPVFVAAILCAIAALSKLTALWGAGAIGLYLLFANWRLFLLFTVVGLASLAGGILGFDALSEGRMFDNLLGVALSGGGSVGETIFHMRRLIEDFTVSGRIIWVLLLPIALIETIGAMTDRSLRPRHIALLMALLVTAVAYTDPGVFSNHLIDVIALSALVFAGFVGRAGLWMATALGAVFLWAAVSTVLLDRNIILAGARIAAGEEFTRDPFSEWVAPEHSLLSQDPYVPVILERRPMVMDAFMFARLAAAKPGFGDELIARIENREIDRIVLMLEIHTAPEDRLMRKVHFGEPVWQAIIENYEKIGETGARHHVYAPKSDE